MRADRDVPTADDVEPNDYVEKELIADQIETSLQITRVVDSGHPA
jgi:hypothetical protein